MTVSAASCIGRRVADSSVLGLAGLANQKSVISLLPINNKTSCNCQWLSHSSFSLRQAVSDSLVCLSLHRLNCFTRLPVGCCSDSRLNFLTGSECKYWGSLPFFCQPDHLLETIFHLNLLGACVAIHRYLFDSSFDRARKKKKKTDEMNVQYVVCCE